MHTHTIHIHTLIPLPLVSPWQCGGGTVNGVTMTAAQCMQKCQEIYERRVEENPKDHDAWYQLAEKVDLPSSRHLITPIYRWTI